MIIDENLRNDAIISYSKFEKNLLEIKKSEKLTFVFKIRRELTRTYKKFMFLKKIKRNFATLLIKIRYYARKKNNKINLRSPKKHHVILVVFQPTGISNDWKDTICQLSRMDIFLHILANGGLTDNDKLYLSSLSDNLNIIERVNFGLDFGAYKDAILELHKTKAPVKKITLMNDSYFFPLFGTVKDLFDKIETRSESFIGLVENTNSDKKDDFHYGSFFLQIRQPILRNPYFFKFWKELSITNSKQETVISGELGLSQTIRDLGFSHTCIFDYDDLYSEIQELTPHILKSLMNDVIVPHSLEWRVLQERYKNHLIEQFCDSDNWKQYSIEWIDHTMRPNNKTHVGAIIYPKMLGMPLLKKDLIHIYGKDSWIKISNEISNLSRISLPK